MVKIKSIGAYRAYELCILLTNSKLLIASPRRAGVKGIVNSLKDRRFSPRSISGMLLTIFSSATLAQALLAVYTYIISKEHIQQKNRVTDLVCEPQPIRASCFLLSIVIFTPAEEKDQAVNRITAHGQLVRI